jgi:heme exporter protein C
MRQRTVTVWGVLAGVTMTAAAVAALGLAPREASMGDVQRLFYFHMPSAWIALGPAFTCVFGFSIAYLVTGKMVYDRVAGAAAEIGILFTSITLMTGPLWAKPVWGVFWTWEPRLTTTLVLWFIYAGYLLLRGLAPPTLRRARLAAVYGIVGWVDVPVVFLSIWWWRTIHPRILGSGGFAMDAAMVWILAVCLAAFTLLFVFLLVLRVRIDEGEARLDNLLDKQDGTGGDK